MATNLKSKHFKLVSNDSCLMTFPIKKCLKERIRGTHGSQPLSPDSHPPLLVPILIDVNQSPPSVRPLKIRHLNPQYSGLTWHKIQVPKMDHKIGSCYSLDSSVVREQASLSPKPLIQIPNPWIQSKAVTFFGIQGNPSIGKSPFLRPGVICNEISFQFTSKCDIWCVKTT